MMRCKRLLGNLALAAGSILLTLLVFELGFRTHAHLENRGVLTPLFEPGPKPAPGSPVTLGEMIRLTRNHRRIYELRPRLEVWFQGAYVTTDDRGCRNLGRPPAPAGARYVVGIGDSFMFGQGVADEEPYLAVLAAELEHRLPERRFAVVNTGVPGYNTTMEVETLAEVGLGFSPEVVIVDFVGNDLALPNFIRTQERVGRLDKSFLADFLHKRRSRRLPRTLEDRLAMFGVVSAEPDEVVPSEFVSDPARVPPEYRDMVGWDAYAAALARLRQLAQEHGFTVVWMTTLVDNTPFKLRARTVAEELGCRIFDAGTVFRRYLKREGYRHYLASPLALSRVDGHPSALGHRLAGTELYAFLEREGLLADPASAAGHPAGEPE